MADVVCIDCKAEGIRTTRKVATTKNGRPVPGNRCATHHRMTKRTRKAQTWESHIGNTYGLTVEEYQAILDHQGGKCAICQRATGASKRLSVDHCHKTGRIRGLLCSPCNRHVLGHLRDDVDSLIRAANYLVDPPAVHAVGEIKAP